VKGEVPMRWRWFAAVVLSCLLGFGSLTGSGTALADNGADSARARDLQERIMNDKDAMALIQALQNDPEVQEALKDPSVISAVNSGDFGSLASNPRFMKLLENPRIKEIQRRMNP
jgi:hypothetical protein